MYNLLEYSKDYSKSTGSLCIYYRDEPNSSSAYLGKPGQLLCIGPFHILNTLKKTYP